MWGKSATSEHRHQCDSQILSCRDKDELFVTNHQNKTQQPCFDFSYITGNHGLAWFSWLLTFSTRSVQEYKLNGKRTFFCLF